MNRPRRILFPFAAAALSAAALLTGCSTKIADPGKLQPAATMLSSASAGVFSAAVDSVEGRRALATDSTQQAQLAQERDALAGTLKFRQRTLAQLVRYSERLDSIAEGGRTEQEKAAAIGQGVADVATAAGALVPHPVAGAAASVAATLATAVSDAKAAAVAIETNRTMQTAAKQAAPAISKLADALAEDLGSLDTILRTTGRDANNLLRSDLPYRALLDDVTKQRESIAAELTPIAGKADSAARTDAASQQRLKDLAAQAKDLDTIEAGARQRWRAREQRAQAVAERAETARAAIRDVRTALGDWADAHAAFLDDLNEGLTPSLSRLADTLERLKATIDALKAAEKKYIDALAAQ